MNIRMMTKEEILLKIESLVEKDLSLSEQIILDICYLRLEALKAREQIAKDLENILANKPQIVYRSPYTYSRN